MPEPFLRLSHADRAEALGVAAGASGRPAHLLEKDVWVVWALQHVFGATYASHLTFKGGTSLSKVYGAIQRFSEDVDLTYDIRTIAPDLVAQSETGMPRSNSEQKRWKKDIEERLEKFLASEVGPGIARALEENKLPAKVRQDVHKLFIEYESVDTSSSKYVAPIVMLEFGARATGEPNERKQITCDAAPHLAELEFPVATPIVMLPERTFWEKATAIHVYCAQGRFRGGDRFARHWHDIARLDAAGIADRAISNRDIATAVAKHKNVFFAEKTSEGAAIDYSLAVAGALNLVPHNEALKILEEDYAAMIRDGLFMEDVEPFADLLARCRSIQQKANEAEKADSAGATPKP
jgi:hypothetical protein